MMEPATLSLQAEHTAPTEQGPPCASSALGAPSALSPQPVGTDAGERGGLWGTRTPSDNHGLGGQTRLRSAPSSREPSLLPLVGERGPSCVLGTSQAPSARPLTFPGPGAMPHLSIEGVTNQAVGRRGGLRTKCFEECRPLESLRRWERPPFTGPAQPHRPGPAPTHAPACVRGCEGARGLGWGSLRLCWEHRPELVRLGQFQAIPSALLTAPG